ncbi:MAG: response regulator transcription factor [Acidimicrobiales bacterium]|uniref:response regulator transcription factor n=1 Tax=Candidatus Poriferisodalis multihospitum TaxID=2983191 RepID=UPI001383A897|nr:response regulator transcription factor [Candidatus Poriferisodalis multihospitum]MDE0321841.1 response regulator transcription factor [Acidimicrobiaceae bacterium]MXV88200.1 response regulator transcription factor [Acidimicrobiales bacterium]MXY02525.1 response regulator transcription factor [Acidimicrobiales bacterium]MYB82825.1 response regulator transcription factor [Acidimicrobiales bacterium]MYG89580.1 response regulator transcription factor [Acidimicrobiales bacterium]
MTASVLVIDDHPVVIDGVRQLLAGQTEFTMIGEATNGVDGVALAKSLGPDLVLLDLKLGDSFAPHLCRLLADASRTSRIIIHTAFDDREPLRACLNAGAVGVVLKDASNLVDALRRVMTGEIYVDPSLVVDPKARALRLGDEGGVYESLTLREYEVLCVMALGRTSKEIAAELHLAENTVRSYTQALLSKLHARNRIEAVAVARELRLL